MRNRDQASVANRLVLEADTAAELMSANPISLRHDAGVCEAIAMLIERNIDAAPVIDDNGRPIGVVAVSDIVIHDREYSQQLRPDILDPTPLPDRKLGETDHTTVAELMTPSVFSVDVETPAADVVRKLLDHKVHQLFVSDRDGVLIGVISTCDILRRLG